MEPRTRADGPDIRLERGRATASLPAEPEPDLGGLWLVARCDREEAQARAEQAGLMWISIPAPEASERGRLALVVEAAIEDELANRGAGAAGFGAATNLDATLSDQLYRGRTVSARGFALSFDTLARVTNLAGALDAEDSAILRWWLTASRERPVRILFDTRDRYLGVYTRPVALETLLGDRSETFLAATDELRRPTNTESASKSEAQVSATPSDATVDAALDAAVDAALDATVDAAVDAALEAEAVFATLSATAALHFAPWADSGDSYSLADLTRELRESSPPPPPSRRSVPPPPPSPAELESVGLAPLSPEEAAAAGQLSLNLESQRGPGVEESQAAPLEQAQLTIQEAGGGVEAPQEPVEAAQETDPATPASEARQFAFRSVLAALEALEHEDLAESPVAPAAEQDWGTPESPEAELFGAGEEDEPNALRAEGDAEQPFEADPAQECAADAEQLPEAVAEQAAELSADAALAAVHEVAAAVHEVVAAAPEALVEPDASPISEGFAALLTHDDQTPLPTRTIRTDQLNRATHAAPTRMAPRETFDDALDRSSQAPDVAPKLGSVPGAQFDAAADAAVDAELEEAVDAEIEAAVHADPKPEVQPLTEVLDCADSHTVVEAEVEQRDVSGPIASHGRATLELIEHPSAEHAVSEHEAPQASVSGADEDDVSVPESTWRGWVRDLEAARGPKPLAVVERLFTSAYVPLLAARMSQDLDAQALDALDSWSTAFAKSYSEAFDALRIRGKRPTMVLDVPDIALRHGRMHGARQAQLILVDGLRFDLGQMVHEHLKELVGRDAACVERLLLWSALPATTATQLELLGRGPQGLREPISSERDVPVARGRAASTLRRVKAGHRDVMKLDLVESRITEPGATRPRAMRGLSAEVAEVLWDHMSGLPARTLVLIFGDHGFAIDPTTGAATHSARTPSAATPEEVLVPAFAWLTGSVH